MSGKEKVFMAWQLDGHVIEACSCKSICPCVLGPAEPDQSWCSAALTFAITKGHSDGVDLSGRTVCWMIDLPKDFASGNGTVCIYIDDKADDRRRQELEAIFSGKKGGPAGVLASLVSNWLPSQSAAITATLGDKPGFSVTGVGQASLTKVVDGAGRVATLSSAPVLGLIEIQKSEIARSDGARFAAPKMRAWQSGGHGSVSPFRWAA
jgi:hypothetical protein